MPSIISQTLPDLTGQFIDDGALELLCLLGSGAYGKVYKARDTSAPLDEPAIYAVKCMPRYEPGSRGEHFQQEELSVHQMVSDHPRIITFHRYFVTDDYLFLVLEYASGGDFFRAMVERQLFRGQTQLIKQAMNQILDAVDCLHRNSIYHRDIKPENLLCDEDGSDIRLTDFGLSTQTSLSREFGCGTRFYMCPESLDPSINGGLYCARFSDLWAVSVIFVNLISGRHPWSSADLTDAGFAAFRSDNDYLQRALGITPESSALLKRCFDENPLRRPNIAQLREAVNEIEVF
ncbi:kinase-like domain-containing protein, partial [Mycena amicta]